MYINDDTWRFMYINDDTWRAVYINDDREELCTLMMIFRWISLKMRKILDKIFS
jgi:hypothetical protein